MSTPYEIIWLDEDKTKVKIGFDLYKKIKPKPDRRAYMRQYRANKKTELIELREKVRHAKTES